MVMPDGTGVTNLVYPYIEFVLANHRTRSAAVTPQVNLSLSFVYCVSKQLIEWIAIES